MGESAGGYLAAMVGTTSGHKEFDQGEYSNQSSDVQAVVDLYGLSDLTKVGADFSAVIQKAHQSPAIPEAMLVNGTLVHVCVSRQNQEFTVWVSDSDWTTVPGWIVARTLLSTSTVHASVARR